MTDGDTPLKEQLLRVPIGEQEAVVEIDRIRDDQFRLAVTVRPFIRLMNRASLPDMK